MPFGDVPAASPAWADLFGAQIPTLRRCIAWTWVDCPTDVRPTVPEMDVSATQLAILRRPETVARPGVET